MMTPMEDKGSNHGFDSGVAGAIFISNRVTKKECLRRKIFGLPTSEVNFVREIKTGTILFLFEYEERKLYGVFEASCAGAMNIIPNAYRQTGKSFPAQVCFKRIWSCHPLIESEFHDAIKDNYYTPQKFNFRLSRKQVFKLLQLFYVKKNAPTFYSPKSSSNVLDSSDSGLVKVRKPAKGRRLKSYEAEEEYSGYKDSGELGPKRLTIHSPSCRPNIDQTRLLDKPTKPMDDPITEHEYMLSQPIICPNDRQTIDLEHKNFERTEAFRGQLPINSTHDHSCYFSSIRDIDLFSPCQSRISQAPPEPSSLPFNSYQDSGLITYRERPFTACNPSNADQHLIRERNLERMGATTFTDMFHPSALLSAYLQEKYDHAPSHEAYGPSAVPNVHFYGRAESYEPLVPSSSCFQERRELVAFPEKYSPSDAKIQYSIERSQSYEPSVPRSSYFLERDGPTAFPETYGPSASTKPYTHERDPSVARIPSPHIAGNIMDLSCSTSGEYRLLPRDHAHPEASKYKGGNDRPQDNGYEVIHGYFPLLDKTENLNPSGLPCNYRESSHPSRSPDYYQEDEYDEDAEYDAKMKSYVKKTSVFARLSKAPEPVMHVSTVNNVERDPSVGEIMERFSKGRGTSPMSKWWNDDKKKLQTSQWENANYVERDPLVGETMGHFSKGRGTPIISKRWMEDDKNLQTTQWEGSESDAAIDAQGGSFGTDREVENESRIPFLDFKRRSKVRKEDTEGEQRNSVEGLPEKSKRRKLVRPSFDKVEHSNSNIFGLGYSGGWVPSMSCIEKGTSIISEASSTNRCHVKVNTEVFDKMEDKMEGMTDNVRGDHVLEEESREHSVCQVPSHGKCYEELAQDSDFCQAPSGSKCNDRKTSRVSMCQTDAAYMNAEGWDGVNKPVMGLNIDHVQKEVTKDLGTCYGNSNEGVSRANVSEAQSVAISNIKESLGLDVCQSDTSAMNVEVKSSADDSAVGLYVDGMDKLQELDIHQSSLGNASGSLGSENLDLSRMAIEKFGVEQTVISERNHQISDKAGNDSSKIGMEKFLAEDENCQVENSIEDAENKEKKNELSKQKTNSIQFGEEIMNETSLQNPSNVSVKNA